MTNQDEEVKLLPCPFCGSEGKKYWMPDLVNQEFRVRCINKSCGIYQKGMGITAWNHRTKEGQGLVELDKYRMLEIANDHYWDTFEIDKNIIMKHLDFVFGLICDKYVSPQVKIDEEKLAKFLCTRFFFGKSGPMIKPWEYASEFNKKVFYEDAKAIADNIGELIK